MKQTILSMLPEYDFLIFKLRTKWENYCEKNHILNPYAIKPLHWEDATIEQQQTLNWKFLTPFSKSKMAIVPTYPDANKEFYEREYIQFGADFLFKEGNVEIMNTWLKEEHQQKLIHKYNISIGAKPMCAKDGQCSLFCNFYKKGCTYNENNL